MSEVEQKLEMTRLGSYNIVRKLARGGMAELYLARSVGPEGFEKLVVLKKILPRYAENPRFVQLFLDEAKLAASLDHPHIVQVHELGRVDGNYFFTMEYVHGQDVRSLLRHTSRQKRQIPIAIAVQIARAMASALHHAHERRRPDGTLRDVVHRDVSPSNILVSYDGAIKLADFGVAKASSSTVRTRTGALKGKVGYMAPEQARGAAIDRRSDVFSLGVVLWELVSMRRLFKSDNDLATIQSIIHTPPTSLVDLRADCPPELDRIARKALEKDPATRYQSAQLMQKDLEELSREQRLDQSPIALGHLMTDVFEAEISAWREAQAVGSTVTDFVISGGISGAPSGPDLVTPASESDFSLEDPADDDDNDGPEIDEEVSDPTALPPQLAPRAGVIARDDGDEATDFGPPPTVDSPVSPPPESFDVDPPTIRPGKLRAITPAKPITPAIRKPKEEENPFETMATRLRPNPLQAGENPFDQAPTAISSPAFTDEAPTVQAPPDILKQAFSDDQATVQGSGYHGAPPPVPPVRDPATEPTELAGPATAPVPRPNPFEDPLAPFAMPPPPVQGRAPSTSLYPLVPQSAPVYVTPPAGIPSMPHGVPPHGMPMQPYPTGSYQGLGYPDPSLDMNLGARHRWLVIAGVAVGLVVLVIVLVLVLGRSPESNDADTPPVDAAVEPTPVVVPDPPVPAKAKGSGAKAPSKGSGTKAGSANPSAAKAGSANAAGKAGSANGSDPAAGSDAAGSGSADESQGSAQPAKQPFKPPVRKPPPPKRR